MGWWPRSQKKNFIPSSPQAPEQEIEQQESTKVLVELYHNDISKNPMIFTEDLVNAFSKCDDNHAITSYVEVTTKSFDVDVSGDTPIIRSNFDVIWSASITFMDLMHIT